MSSSADLWVSVGNIAKKMTAEIRKGHAGSEKCQRLFSDYIKIHEALLRRHAVVDTGASVEDLLNTIPDTKPLPTKMDRKGLMALAKQLAQVSSAASSGPVDEEPPYES